MDIGGAVAAMQLGHRVCRSGWNGKGMWIALMRPNPAHAQGRIDMTLPYVYMKTADDQLVPWLCSQTDLLADDWELV